MQAPSLAYSPSQLSRLRELIVRHFSEEELRNVCFDLGIDYDSLPAQGKAGKARELVDLRRRTDRIAELIDECRTQRPEVNWWREIREATTTAFHAPYPRKDGLVGRANDLANLDNALRPQGAERPRPVILVGMPGVGKTQLAVEYAYGRRDDYPDGVYWVDAAQDLTVELAALARRIGRRVDDAPDSDRLAVLSEALTDYFLNHSRALLVLDDAADPQALHQLATFPCHLLVTSRQRHDDLPFQVVEVSVLSREAALELLLSARSRRDTLKHWQAHRDLAETDPERIAALTICRALGYLPLALALAGSYLGRYQSVTLSGYRDRLRDEGGLAVDRTGWLPDHTRAVAATLKVQWDSLDDEKAQIVLMAAALLGEEDEAPLSYLAVLSGLAGAAARGYPAPLEEAALRPLRALSLIEGFTEHHVRLHPLVKEFALRQVSEFGREKLYARFEANVVNALNEPGLHHEQAIVAGECLLRLGGSSDTARLAVVRSLYDLMRDRRRSEMPRRRAARLLTRWNWLAGIRDVSPDDVLTYLELVAPFADNPVERETLLMKYIAPMLYASTVRLSDRQRVQFLIFRAAMLGQARELDEAARDYMEAGRIVNVIMTARQDLPDDRKLAVRVYLGAGNIARVRGEIMFEPSTPQWIEEMQRAVNFYLTAARWARDYGRDALLEANTHEELSHTYALLSDWPQAEQYAQSALDVLEQGKGHAGDPEAYVRNYAWALETACDMLMQKARRLQALEVFETAYRCAWKEIIMLRQSFGWASDSGLIYGHFNAGEVLLEMSRLSGCRVTRPLRKACAHWRMALKVASALGVPDMNDEIAKRLQQHCP